jgi:uncharacterized protein YdhG (YjbR/CyaY superfamily)
MNKDGVTQYIEKQDSPKKEILNRLRKLIGETVPFAEECLSYGVPAFKENHDIVMYSAFKEHYGIYPGPAAISAFKKELKGYETSKGTIRFPLDKPIPAGLIKKIVKYVFNKNKKK